MKSQPIDQTDFTIRLITLGQSGTGKTSIINRYVVNSKKDNYFSNQYILTIGVDYKQKQIQAQNYKVNLQIWDTAGQERFKTITRQYYHGSHGIVLVYDVTDRHSFQKVEYWLEEIKNQNGGETQIFLLANKIDMDIHRKVSEQEGKSAAKFYNLGYFEVSAKYGTGVEQAFAFTVDKIISQLRKNQICQSKSNCASLISKTMNEPRKKKCCS